jgi:hypothetical protein
MKKPIRWPKPKGFHLDDDSGLLIGNRIHRVVGGQVIGQQNVAGDVVNSFGVPGRRRPAAEKSREGQARGQGARETVGRQVGDPEVGCPPGCPRVGSWL